MVYRMGTTEKVPKDMTKLWPLSIDPKVDRGRDMTEDEIKRTIALYGGRKVKDTD